MGWFEKSIDRIRSDLIRMRDELYANAIRLEGTGNLLWKITELALEENLQVWAHPKLEDVIPKSKYTTIFKEFSKKAEDYGINVLMLGNELSLEVNLQTNQTQSYTERCLNMEKYVHKPLKENPEKFQKFITELIEIARKHFSGKITYASASWELPLINWEKLDIVACNLFLYTKTQQTYLNQLLKMKQYGKPAILSEIAYQTIDKAFQAGPIWWYQNKHKTTYSEEAQAKCFKNNLKLIKKANLNGCFIHQWDENQTAGKGDHGFGIIKMNGTPKKAFHIIKNFYKNWK